MIVITISSENEKLTLHFLQAGRVIRFVDDGRRFGSKHLGGVWSLVSDTPPQYTQAMVLEALDLPKP